MANHSSFSTVLFTVVFLISCLTHARAFDGEIRSTPDDNVFTAIDENALVSRRNAWKLGDYECSKLSPQPTDDSSNDQCRKACRESNECKVYHFEWSAKKCTIYVSGKKGPVTKCTNTSNMRSALSPSTQIFGCSYLGNTEMIPGVKSNKDCASRCDENNCIGFEYENSSNVCNIILSSGPRIGLKCTRIKVECNCFRRITLDRLIEDIIRGESDYVENGSCDVDNPDEIYLNYFDREKSLSLAYGVTVDDNESSCIDGDELITISADEAIECQSLIQGSCRTLQEEMKKSCPCFDAVTIESLLNRINNNAYKYDAETSCISDDFFISITGIPIEAPGPPYRARIGYGAGTSMCLKQGDILQGTTREQAKTCFDIIEKACERVKPVSYTNCPCFTPDMLTTFVEKINNGVKYEYDPHVSCKFNNPNEARISAKNRDWNIPWPMYFEASKSNGWNDCVRDGERQFGQIFTSEADTCISYLKDACSLVHK